MFNAKRQKFGGIMALITILAGIFLIAFGSVSVNKHMSVRNWPESTATIIDYEESIEKSSRNNTSSNDISISNSSSYTKMYAPVVKYRVDGKEYIGTASSKSSTKPKVNSAIAIKYNPDSPSQFITNRSLYLICGVLMLAGGILSIVFAIVFYIKSRKRSQNINKLIQSNNKIKGIITDIRDTGRSNNSVLYKIIVTAPDASGQVREYQSDSVKGSFGLGGIAIKTLSSKAIPIDVFIDPQNPKNYYVDISDIPTLTADTINNLIGDAASQVISAVNTPTAQTTENAPQPQQATPSSGGGYASMNIAPAVSAPSEPDSDATNNQQPTQQQ